MFVGGKMILKKHMIMLEYTNLIQEIPLKALYLSKFASLTPILDSSAMIPN